MVSAYSHYLGWGWLRLALSHFYSVGSRCILVVWAVTDVTAVVNASTRDILEDAAQIDERIHVDATAEDVWVPQEIPGAPHLWALPLEDLPKCRYFPHLPFPLCPFPVIYTNMLWSCALL